MKSMLCEASSVIKAIESVWKQAGKPSEFTVKVLEAGEKGFFWFTKQPAIVSISYDPKKQTEKDTVVSAPQKKETSHAPQHHQPKKRTQDKEHRQPYTQQQHEAKKEVIREPRRQQPTHHETIQQQKVQVQPQKNTELNETSLPPVAAIWTEEYIADISQWLKETLVILKSDTIFTTSADKKILRIKLDKYLIPEAEENKSLYISLGNLFMQALKKKNKKKFQGFSILITLNDTTSHEQRNQTPAE